jgi:hypothetical protein
MRNKTLMVGSAVTLAALFFGSPEKVGSTRTARRAGRSSLPVVRCWKTADNESRRRCRSQKWCG